MRVESVALLPCSILPERSPVTVDLDGAQVEDCLRALDAPPHAGALHAIAHQVTARALDDAAPDRVAAGEVYVVPHVAPVVVQVADRLHDLGSVSLREIPLGELPAKVSDDVADLSLANELQL